jgi:peptidoglycan/LPS O-acetylase OafA/YrhL
MFGLFRLLLALEVVIHHLADRQPEGWYSVYAFYTLSGYLMTLVITRKYPLNPHGGTNFLINRVLRIYPPYLTMALLAWLLLSLPGTARVAHQLVQVPPMGLPSGGVGWFTNVFILGWKVKVPKLEPQVWSVYRELFFCAAIFFVFARSRRLALVWFVCSALYAVSVVWRGYRIFEIYTTFQGASLSYSAGCCLFHFRDRLRFLTRPLFPLIGLAAVLPFLLEYLRPHFFREDSVVPFYANVVLSAYLVLLLSTLKAPKRIFQIDQYLGNLSYPIYLCHYNVAVVVAAVLRWPPVESYRLLLAGLPAILLCAWLVNKYVERTIGYGYDKRRQAAQKTARPPAMPASGTIALELRPESD